MAIGSHQSARMRSDVWLTPPAILAALGPFDLDPCAAPEPRPWPTARTMIARPANGLLARWHGRVWLNPPYGRGIGRWMARLALHGIGTALVFARTDTDWFERSVWGAESAAAALFLYGRVNFHRADGTRSPKNAGAPSVLIAYGPGDAEALHGSGLDGRFVPLSRPAALYLVLSPPAGKAGVGDALTWRALVADVLAGLGAAATLSDLYAAIAAHPKATGRAHWRAKVRQTVQGSGFQRVGPAQYALEGVG